MPGPISPRFFRCSIHLVVGGALEESGLRTVTKNFTGKKKVTDKEDVCH